MSKRRVTVIAVALGVVAAGAIPTLATPGGGGGGGGGGGSGGGGSSGKPVISFKNVNFSVAEGGNATITLSRNGTGAPSSVIVEPGGEAVGTTGGAACTVGTTPPDYRTGTASPAGGYMATFSNKATSASVLIPTCNDSVWRGPRTVQLTMDTFVNGQPGSKNTAILTITDPDAKPVVTIDTPAAANEGNLQSFTVHLTGTSVLPVSVKVSTADQSAAFGHAVGGTAGSGDYDSGSQTFAWAPGDNTNRSFDVQTTDDAVDEPAETYLAVLTLPQNASIGGTGSATGTINDGDAAPTIAIADGSTDEGDSGQTGESFTVSISGPTASDIDLHWSTSAISTAKGWNIGDAKNDCAHNASDGTDLVSDAGTLHFAASASTPANQTITVQICGDEDFESNEYFLTELDTPSYGSFSDWAALGTIVNDDTDYSGFESGLQDWVAYQDGTAPLGLISTDQANTGTHSMLLGTPDNGCSFEPDGVSGVYRDFAIPASGTTTLNYSVFELGDGSGNFDEQFAQVRDATTNAVLETIFNDGYTYAGVWDDRTFDISAYAGQTVRVFFGVYQDALGCPSSMYVDDVFLTNA